MIATIQKVGNTVWTTAKTTNRKYQKIELVLRSNSGETVKIIIHKCITSYLKRYIHLDLLWFMGCQRKQLYTSTGCKGQDIQLQNRIFRRDTENHNR